MSRHGPPGADVTRPQGSVVRRAVPDPAQEEPGRQPGSQHVTFQTPPEEPLTRAFLGNSILSSVAAVCLWERGRGIGEQTLGLLVPRSSSGWEGGWGVRTGVVGGSLWTPHGFLVAHRCHCHPLPGTPARGLLLYLQGAGLPR